MRLRWVTMRTVLGAVSVMFLVAGVVTAQAPTGTTSQTTPDGTPAYRILRTPDGHPDLQGIWSFATVTPMERPCEFEGKRRSRLRKRLNSRSS